MMASEYTGFVPQYDTSPSEWASEHQLSLNRQATSPVWEEDIDFQQYIRTARDPSNAADLWPDVQKVYQALGGAFGAVANPIRAALGLPEAEEPDMSGWASVWSSMYGSETEQRAQEFAREVERVYYANREELPAEWILAQDPDDLRMLSVPGFQEAAQYIEQAQQYASSRRMFLSQYETELEKRIEAAKAAKEQEALTPTNVGGVLLGWLDVVTGPHEMRHVDESLIALTPEERAQIEENLMNEMLGFTQGPELPEGAPEAPAFPDIATMTTAQRADALQQYERDYREWRTSFERWTQEQSLEQLEEWGSFAPVMWTLGQVNDAIAKGIGNTVLGPLDQVLGGTLTTWWVNKKADMSGLLDPNNPLPDEILMREAQMFGISAYWKMMKDNNPQYYQEYVDMAGGDEVMAFGFFAADAESDPEIQGQLDALFTQTQIEREVTVDEALDDSDYRPDQLVLDLLAWYGRAVPMRIATGMAVFVRSLAGEDPIWADGWKNAWTELWRQVDEADRSPAKALGIDGSLVGLAVDLTGGIMADPLTYIFGPRLKSAAGGLSSVDDLPRLMTSAGLRRVRNDLIRWARRPSVGTGEFLAQADWLADVGEASTFLEVARAVEQKVWTNPWRSGPLGAVSNEVEINTLVGLMDDVQRRALAEHAANPGLASWATEHLPTTGVPKPLVILVDRATGRFAVTSEGATLRQLAGYQSIGAAKFPTTIRIVDALPGRLPGVDLAPLLRAGESMQRTRRSQVQRISVTDSMTAADYLRPDQVLPKRLVMGDDIFEVEAKIDQVIERALRKGARLPDASYLLTSYMHAGALRKALRTMAPGRWLDRYFTKQFTRDVLDATGIGAERQQLDTITRLFAARDPARLEYWRTRLMDTRRRWARNEVAFADEMKSLEPLMQEMRQLRGELGTALGPDRLRQLEAELQAANQGWASARARAGIEQEVAAAKPLTDTTPLAHTNLETGEISLNRIAIEEDWTAGTPYLRGERGPTSAQKAQVFSDMGIDVDALRNELGSVERYQDFINLHEQAHQILHRDVPYPDDLMSPEAIAMETEATRWALDQMGIDMRSLRAKPATDVIYPKLSGIMDADDATRVGAAKALTDDELVAALVRLGDDYEMSASRVQHADLAAYYERVLMSRQALLGEARLRPGFNQAVEKFFSNPKNRVGRTSRMEEYFPGLDLKAAPVVPKVTPRVMHSGGAAGADTVFEEAARNAGIEVQAHSFRGHSTSSSARVEHTAEELAEADEYLTRANETLGRRFPTSSQYTNNLLRRNYFQVRDSDQVIAVGWFKDGQVDGGTAWATQMGIDMGKPVFLFDQASNTWYTWAEQRGVQAAWVPCEVPSLSESFAGIGSRNLTDAGREAIVGLFEKPGATIDLNVLEALPERTPLPASGMRALEQDVALAPEPTWLTEAAARRTRAGAEWESARLRHEQATARLSSLEDAIQESMFKGRQKYGLRDTHDLQQLFDEMFDDYNRRYIARSHELEDGRWVGGGNAISNPWKPFVDPNTGLVPWQVLKKGQYRTTRSLKKWVSENIGPTGHLEGQPWGYGGHGTAGLPKERGRQILNSAVIEREKALASRDPEAVLHALSYTAESPMTLSLPMSPLEMVLASETGGGWYVRACQRLSLYAMREAAWMFQRWWKLDKVFRPATAATVSLDELWRAFQTAGFEAVNRWLQDRMLFMQARAEALLHHGARARGWHTTMAGKGMQYLSPAKQERIRLLGDYPAMYKRAERQAYEGYGLGFEDIMPGERGYVDAARAHAGLLLQDSGFRAALRGEDAFHDWWFSEANSRMPSATVVDETGRFRTFANWRDAYNGWRYLFDDVVLRAARDAGKFNEVRQVFVDLAKRIDDTGGMRVFEIPNWVTEYMGPVRGVRMATPKNLGGQARRFGTQHVQELFFDKFFMDPTNYRRGFIQQLRREVETRRLTKLFESQGKQIIPDYAVNDILGIRGLHGAGSGPLGGVIQDMLWDAGYVTEGRIAKIAEESAMQEVQNIMYVWDMGSRGGTQVQSIFPFGKPWADMMGFWGREVLRRPALRGWINDMNFMHIGDIANAIVDHIPFNPKAAAFVSRLAATDFTIDSIAPGVDLPDQIQQIDFSPLFFLPTGGENPFMSLLPGIGYLPLWAIDNYLIGIDPLEDPVGYEKRLELLSGILPTLQYQRPGGFLSLPRLLGGGSTETALSILADVGASWLNMPYYTLSNMIGDITMETARNRMASAILSDPEELELLLSAEDVDEFKALVDSLAMRANDSAGGMHMIQKALRWVMPARMTVDYGTDEIYDIWLEAGKQFEWLNPNPEVDPTTIEDQDERRQVGSDIRRIFFDAPSWQRDLMIYQYPALAINLISSWKWTELAVAEIPDAARSAYRIGSSEEALALHQEYVDRGFVRPVQAQEKILQVVGMIQAARHDVPQHLYSRIASQFNDYIWESLVTPETKANLQRWVNTPFGSTYHITDARQLWEMWGSLQDDLEEMWAESQGIEQASDDPEWEALREAIHIPEDEQAHSTDWPGISDAPQWFDEEMTIYRLDNQTMQLINALGLEFRPGTGAAGDLFRQMQPLMADTGGIAMQYAEVAYREYIDDRSVSQDVALSQLKNLAFREEFAEDTTAKRQIQAFIVMQDVTRRQAGEAGLITPSDAREVREEFAKIEELCAGIPMDFNLIWTDAFERTFGPRDFDEDLPTPPDNVFNPDGSMGPYTEQPYILEIVDGDTIRVRRSGSVPVEPIFGQSWLQFNRPAEAPVPQEYSVRLIGVRAREPGQEGALEDTRRLREALRRAYEQNIPVYLVRDPELGYTDYFNRQLAWLFIGDEPFYFREELESAILNGWR